MKYKRILLKLSGESLQGESAFGYNQEAVNAIVDEIGKLHKGGTEIAIVIGGGNIMRGKNIAGHGVSPATADYMGMLATCMNGLALQSRLQKNGIDAILQTAIKMEPVAEQFSRRRAVEYLEQGKVVIFGSGTGNPYFTTDTAAALRAAEINADAILVGKTIDGVYSDDPKINSAAIKYDNITYQDILNKDLKVMDLTAISLCKENNIPLVVFALQEPENIIKAIKGEKIGTLVN